MRRGVTGRGAPALSGPGAGRPPRPAREYPPMLSLVAATIFMASFGLVVRAAQRRELDLLAVGLLNYITAAVVYGVWCASAGLLRCAPMTAVIGVIGGLVYGGGFFFVLPPMQWRGAGIVVAVMGLSVLIPVCFSLLVWHERLTPVRGAGLVLALVALPLLGLDKGLLAERLTLKMALVMLGLFVFNGGCLLIQKWYHVAGRAAERPVFLGYLFATAGLVLARACAARRSRVARLEVGFGVLLGACNLLASLLLLAALDRLPGVIVFPIMQAGMMVFAAAFAAVVWRELPGRLGLLGIATAASAAALINLTAGK